MFHLQAFEVKGKGDAGGPTLLISDMRVNLEKPAEKNVFVRMTWEEEELMTWRVKRNAEEFSWANQTFKM